MYFVSLHGQATSFSPGVQRLADRMNAGNELAVGAEQVDNRATHARHDAHVDDDIGAVGDLDADLADVRAQRPHRKRDHVHRAAAHAAVEQPVAASRASRPGPSSCWSGRRRPWLLAADEGAILHASDVARVGQGKEAVRALGRVEPLQRARRGPSPRTAGRTPPASRRTRPRGRASSAGRSRSPRRSASCDGRYDGALTSCSASNALMNCASLCGRAPPPGTPLSCLTASRIVAASDRQDRRLARQSPATGRGEILAAAATTDRCLRVRIRSSLAAGHDARSSDRATAQPTAGPSIAPTPQVPDLSCRGR